MLLILFWISYILYNVSYLFSVLGLGSLVLLLMLMYFSNVLYLKFLIVLIYISGIVIFILYISCMCWYTNMKMHILFLFFTLFFFLLFDLGMSVKIFDVGEYLWMFLFFALVFSNLINIYSLNLFKISGSLRF